MVHGNKALIRYSQDEYILRFTNSDNVQLECHFRINDKGVAYRFRLPKGETPFVTPWRLMVIGQLADIVESTLGTDLAAPAQADARLANFKPGLASWS
ncbi:MAG: glycoside hydrolase family 97 N-terminal domain-containing protein [Saprospiraceae bacterium]